MVSNVLLKPGKQDSQPFPHPPGGLSCHRRWGWMSNPAFHKSVLAGPDHLFDLHVPCDSIQDDLPQHQGLANRPGYPSSSCRWVSPLLISRKRNLHSPNRLDVKPTDPRTKKNPRIRILRVTPGLEPVLICWLAVFFCFFPHLLCIWKDRGKHHLCSWSLNQLSQVPEVSWLLSERLQGLGTVFRDSLRLLVATSLLPIWKKSIKDKQSKAVFRAGVSLHVLNPSPKETGLAGIRYLLFSSERTLLWKWPSFFLYGSSFDAETGWTIVLVIVQFHLQTLISVYGGHLGRWGNHRGAIPATPGRNPSPLPPIP